MSIPEKTLTIIEEEAEKYEKQQGLITADPYYKVFQEYLRKDFIAGAKRGYEMAMANMDKDLGCAFWAGYYEGFDFPVPDKETTEADFQKWLKEYKTEHYER